MTRIPWIAIFTIFLYFSSAQIVPYNNTASLNHTTLSNKTTTVTTNVTVTTCSTTPAKPIVDINALETRRKKKKRTSTSSSSSSSSSDTTDKESLGGDESMSSFSWSDSDEKIKGLKKKRRQCTPCPEDMKKKWKDPSIQWICGAYQRARRSFKSLCMMYYRNCQDGTMFTKIHDHRCANASRSDAPHQRHGLHFIYDYHVTLSDESSDSKSSGSSGSSVSTSYD